MIVTYTYPGDPTTTADLMFGLEFKVRHPDREVVISGGYAAPQHIPVEDAICDSCNA